MIRRVRVIGVLRGCPPAHAVRIARAARSGGLLAIEVTMDSDRAADQIERIRAEVGDHMTVGAGTVRSATDVDVAVAAGADFLVAPGFDPDIVGRALDLGVTFVPGVMTPSETSAAVRMLTGAGFEPICKLFPAGALGTAHLLAMRGPFADVRWICTGGIGNDDASAFIGAGADAVGLGSSLFPPRALASGDDALVEASVRRVVTALSD